MCSGFRSGKSCNSHIKLRKRYFAPGMVHGFPVELRQVFLNLIGNAIQAMPERRKTAASRFVKRMTGPVRRRGIAVSIVDTGVGIKPQDSRKLFEPFFSTKSTKGTGLGLWISRGIIQKYDGRISFRSLRNGNGCATCFRVFLPTSSKLQPGKHVDWRSVIVQPNRDQPERSWRRNDARLTSRLVLLVGRHSQKEGCSSSQSFEPNTSLSACHSSAYSRTSRS